MFDYILNGQGHGIGADDRMDLVRWNPGLMRPYLVHKGGRNIPYVTINVGRDPNTGQAIQRAVSVMELQRRGVNSPVFNATSLRKEEWIILDQKVIREARFRLRGWSDLVKRNSFGGFNGMSKTILEHEVMSDHGEALVDMDGLTEGRTDAPRFQVRGLPLPITHADFYYSSRRLASSRNTGTPLDTASAEACGRRVAEKIEKNLLGVDTGLAYGGTGPLTGGGAYDITSQVYGYTNYPNRLTKTNMYRPTGNGRSGTGWTPLDTVKDVLAMRQTLMNQKFYGPYMIYHSNDWDAYLDEDYFTTTGTGSIQGLSPQTLRDRLRSIEGVEDVKRLDFLMSAAPASTDIVSVENTFPFTMIMVQMTEDVVRAVNGMDITTIQWESVGGMRLNFKVLAIQVPDIRSTFNGNCGVLHANASASPA